MKSGEWGRIVWQLKVGEEKTLIPVVWGPLLLTSVYEEFSPSGKYYSPPGEYYFFTQIFFIYIGGRIVHGHDAGRAVRALHDTVAMSKAVAKAVSMTDKGR